MDIINITEHKRNEYHERILKSDFSYKCDSNFGFLTRKESPSPPLMTKLSTRDKRDLHPIAHVGVAPRTNSKLWIRVHVTIFEPLSPSIVTRSFIVKIFSSSLTNSIDVLRYSSATSLTKVTNIYQFDTERKRNKYIFIA